jgi:P27 family predicted phage terminase small subunit
MMPRGGHNKKANRLKVLENRPGAKVDNTPKTPPIFPHTPPRGMPKEARQFWKKYAPMLDRAGMVRASDIPAFEILAMTYATIKDAEKEITERGLLVDGARGGLVKNPAISILNAARQQFRLMASDFGLTPSARERLGGQVPQDEPDPMESLLSGI